MPALSRAATCGLLLVVTAAAADPLDVLLDTEWFGDIDASQLDEPSGLVFHPGRGTLFVVGDEGDIAELRPDGSLLQRTSFSDTDFEGITCNPASGLLYAAVEGREAIFEIDPETLGLRREFTVERSVGGRTVLAEGGGGFEAITFVPDGGGGGLLVLSNQSFDLDSEDDISALLEVELPAPGASGVLPIHRHLPIPLPDLSALRYDAATDRFWAVSDGPNLLSEIDRDGHVLRVRAFPGDNQEGLAIDDKGFLYIAQDSGGIIKLRLR